MNPRRLWMSLAAAVLLAGCAAPAPDAPLAAPEVRRAMAPAGTLRVAVYPGSPTSLVRVAPRSEMRGLTVDIGDQLGRRLGVPVEVIVLPRVAEVVAAIQRGEADMTITNATAERGRVVDGRWGLEHLAIATGKGRDAALPWLRAFAQSVQAEGLVARAAARAGLRGTAAPEAR